MTFHPVTIRGGQTSPRRETHAAVGVEEEHGGASDAQTVGQGIECGFVDVLEPLGAADRLRQLRTNRDRRAVGRRRGHVLLL